jgi:hypothetical protein
VLPFSCFGIVEYRIGLACRNPELTSLSLYRVVIPSEMLLYLVKEDLYPLLFPPLFLLYLPYLKIPTSSGAHSWTSRPPIRYPALEPIRQTEREDPSWTPDRTSLQK